MGAAPAPATGVVRPTSAGSGVCSGGSSKAGPRAINAAAAATTAPRGAARRQRMRVGALTRTTSPSFGSAPLERRPGPRTAAIVTRRLPKPAPEYELVLMLDPESPDERRDQIAADARQRIEAGGSLKHDAAWGMRKMAYEIRQRTEADYRFYRFENGGSLLDDLNHNLRIADGVLRFRIFKVDPGSPATEPPPPMSLAASGPPRGGRRGDGQRGRGDGPRPAGRDDESRPEPQAPSGEPATPATEPAETPAQPAPAAEADGEPAPAEAPPPDTGEEQ